RYCERTFAIGLRSGWQLPRFFQAQSGGRAETFQLFPPEGFRRSLILPAQPADIVAIKARLLQLQFLSLAEGRIPAEGFRQQNAGTPSVHQNVMVAPDEEAAFIAGMEQRKPQQRSPRHVEPPLPVLLQKGPPLLVLRLRAAMTPVFLLPFYVNLLSHDLYRLFEAVP